MDNPGKLKNVKKIAVLRANGLGDFIVTLPAFAALRNTYPDAEIVLLGAPWHQQFLVKGRTCIDRVVIVPAMKGIRDEAGVTENAGEQYTFFKRMQAEQFDVAINFQGRGIAGNPFIKRLCPKLTVGTWCNEAERIDRSVAYYYYQHEVARYLEIVRLIGATTDIIEPQLAILDMDKAEISDLVFSLEEKPFVILNPVAKDLRRMWPLEKYIQLTDSLRKKNMEVVLTGSTAEHSVIDTIIGRMAYSVINASGISIGGLAALTAAASLMISPDTGPLHVAQAVQCPTVGIYWAPNVINWAPLNRKIHRPVISWKMQCPRCGVIPNTPYPFEPSASCKHEVSFVSDITAEDVLKAAEELLSGNNQQRKKYKIQPELILIEQE